MTKPKAPRVKKPKSSPPVVQPGKKDLAGGVSEEKQFLIAGVGASAGGLKAFTQLFENLPSDSGIAFVIVQHLAADHDSMLSELLSKVTDIPVIEVFDGMTVKPDHVYVIPPNTEMEILHGVLHLQPRSGVRGLHMPVDSFLYSLSADQGDKAIAIIMSGTGSDGSLGVAAIKGAGGIVFAQEEKSAKYPTMPCNAIATGCVDFILPVNRIAKELVRISRHPYLGLMKTHGPGQSITEENTNLDKIFLILRAQTSIDFAHYKLSTVKRRIMRRILLQGKENVDNYLKIIRDDPAEVENLSRELLINVTSFFREPETCDLLKKSVLPVLIRKASSDIPLRIWVPGCATGEEAYSIAICLLEYISDNNIVRPIQIFATDIDEAAIEKARKGEYPENISKKISPERLRKFFVKSGNCYLISKAIREVCIFARQNLATDPPFSKLDFISCRNVLIYFGSFYQKKAMQMMHYALKPSGFLRLGVSETVGKFSNAFTIINKKHKIYKKIGLESNLHFGERDEQFSKTADPRSALVGANKAATLSNVQDIADRLVLSRYSPAGVVVDENMKVVQFRGYTSPYLEHGPGEASLDLFKLCREGLVLELRKAIQKAKKTNAPVKKEAVWVSTSMGRKISPLLVDIAVTPFKGPATQDLFFLVLFEETAGPTPIAEKKVKSPPGEKGEIERLQQELASAKEYLTTVTAEHEAASEELMAINEELQSSNEEMQSINEELETAKEELQSTNEELITVNEELSIRHDEMTLVNNDLINVLTGIEIPVILLSNELQIRRFNHSAGEILNLISSDAGRPITDIRTNLNVPGLKQKILTVIDTLTINVQEIQSTEGRWYSLAIRPYKTLDNRIDGVLITLVDIDQLKEIAEERGQLIKKLEEALAKVKLLAGIVPICATCKKIRDDKGYWNQLEAYISEHSEAHFSHGMCPDCHKKAIKEIEDDNND